MNRLWVRLSFAFTAVVLVAVVIILATGYIISQFESDDERFASRVLNRQAGLVSLLEDYYQTHRSWDGVTPILSGAQATSVRPDTSYLLADSGKKLIFHHQPELIGQSLDGIEASFVQPLKVDGQIVGYTGFVKMDNPGGDDRPPPFTRDLVQSLLYLAVVGGSVGLIFGVITSRTLTAPLGKLAAAARAIGGRNLSQRVDETGSDEVIAVARAFNEMASDLEEAERLRRNLLADVAHELRTPLSVVQGNLRAILDEVYPLDLSEMGRLYEQTRLLSRLVNDLHELAQAEAHQLPLNLQETNLRQLAQATASAFAPSAEEKQVQLLVDVPDGLPAVNIDAVRVAQVLHNLLANALRHTPANGQITISATATGDTVNVLVADDGEGIASEHLPHIFDRFYRSDPARTRDRGGAGLGLAIARAIVEAHQGQIIASSDGPGTGSTFTLQFPPNGHS
jgi:signal transduction histidine kinase